MRRYLVSSGQNPKSLSNMAHCPEQHTHTNTFLPHSTSCTRLRQCAWPDHSLTGEKLKCRDSDHLRATYGLEKVEEAAKANISSRSRPCPSNCHPYFQILQGKVFSEMNLLILLPDCRAPVQPVSSARKFPLCLMNSCQSFTTLG